MAEQTATAPAQPAAEAVQPVDVVMKTSKGDMTIRLNPEQAPVTVKNFLTYVDKGFYKGLVFHRVMPGFMIQGGGMTADMSQKPTGAPIKNESDNGLRNSRGTIAMARTANPDSATSQFFINLVNNEFLNNRPGRPGYAVFGELIKGQEVMDAIASVKTGNRGPHANVPVEPVFILAVERVKEAQ
ncbi:peptidylprolyl isomerase [Endozoicomonas sp. 4G]|uniref:peptidylprolyl isomerase n=1 Tax=Endozoicomonas sp. 4G TaxID=2872754 RepID=UPI00207892FA|nr:peptidylprolyl isomerase [Endozoicomonas sp. 4G]